MNTETKESLSKQGTKKRKKNVLRALFVLFILGAFIFIGSTSISLLNKTKELDLTMPYDITTTLNTALVGTGIQTAETFSNDLCVARDGVSVTGLDLPDNEKAALFSLDDKEVLYAKNMYQRAFPASVTKLMTGLLTIEHGNFDDVVTITKEMVTLEDGSQLCGFKEGDQVSVKQLYYGLMVYSGNDAAMALAIKIGGSVQNFVNMMNEKARQLGASDTHFMNPHGLHDDNHYTTVYDIYLMMNANMKHQEFLDVIQVSLYTISYKTLTWDNTYIDAKINVESTDKYLRNEAKAPKNVTILGGKTGTTSQAGACLSILSQNSYGKPYISIVLNAKNKSLLYQHMNKLLNQINL